MDLIILLHILTIGNIATSMKICPKLFCVVGIHSASQRKVDYWEHTLYWNLSRIVCSFVYRFGFLLLSIVAPVGFSGFLFFSLFCSYWDYEVSSYIKIKMHLVNTLLVFWILVMQENELFQASYGDLLQRGIQNPVKHKRRNFLRRKLRTESRENYFSEKLHLRYLTGRCTIIKITNF